MTRLLALLLLVLLQACSKAPQGYASMQHMVTEGAAAPSIRERSKFLAYEHSVTIDAAEAEVKPLLDRLVAACQADTANSCILLGSGIETGRNFSAHVRVRIKPAGVDKLVALAATGGELASRDTTAEDLEGPIRDSEKRLAMLHNYQQKLQALEQKATDAASLIKVSEELASVQSELEAADGRNARLMERVNLDLLNIAIQSQSRRAFWSPVKRSVQDFGQNLSEGIASAIVGVAYLIPWALVLTVLVFVLRKIWRRIKKRPA